MKSIIRLSMALGVLALGIGLFSRNVTLDIGTLENGWIGTKITVGDRNYGIGISVSSVPGEKDSFNQVTSSICPHAKRNLIVLTSPEIVGPRNWSIDLDMEE